jgi:hypothetical protein
MSRSRDARLRAHVNSPLAPWSACRATPQPTTHARTHVTACARMPPPRDARRASQPSPTAAPAPAGGWLTRSGMGRASGGVGVKRQQNRPGVASARSMCSGQPSRSDYTPERLAFSRAYTRALRPSWHAAGTRATACAGGLERHLTTSAAESHGGPSRPPQARRGRCDALARAAGDDGASGHPHAHAAPVQAARTLPSEHHGGDPGRELHRSPNPLMRSAITAPRWRPRSGVAPTDVRAIGRTRRIAHADAGGPGRAPRRAPRDAGVALRPVARPPHDTRRVEASSVKVRAVRRCAGATRARRRLPPSRPIAMCDGGGTRRGRTGLTKRDSCARDSGERDSSACDSCERDSASST